MTRAMRFGPLFGMLLLAVAVCAAPPAPPAPARDEDPRVARLRADLQEAGAVLAGTTNENERTVLEKRVRILRDELENATNLLSIEQQEQQLAHRRGASIEAALREAVFAIDPNVEEARKQLDALTARIVGMTDERSTLETQRTDTPQTEEESLRQADLQQQLLTLGAHIEAARCERETLDVRVDLAQEARSITDHLGEIQAGHRPTIRELLAKRRAVATARKKAAAYRDLVERLRTRRNNANAAAKLAQQRYDQLDDEIRILEDRMAIERRARGATPAEQQAARARYAQARQLYYQSRSEKNALKERIGYMREQVTHLDASIQLAQRGLELMQRESDYAARNYQDAHDRYFRLILIPLGLVAGIVLLYFLVSRLLLPMFYQRDALFVARRLGGYLVALLALMVLCVYFLEDLKAVAAVLGLAGAAIIIALGDLCSAFAGWFVIASSRKVRVGDRVEIDGQRGDVVDVQLLRTTLLELNNWLGVDEPTGRVIAIPNNFIFKSAVFNYSHVHPYIWGKVDVTITFETPARLAEEVLLKCLTEETREEFAAAAAGADRIEHRYGADHRSYYAPRVHSVIADSGIAFSLFYMCHYRRFAGTRDKINGRIVAEFQADPRLQFAYPTERHIPTIPAPEGTPTAWWTPEANGPETQRPD